MFEWYLDFSYILLIAAGTLCVFSVVRCWLPFNCRGSMCMHTFEWPMLCGSLEPKSYANQRAEC